MASSTPDHATNLEATLVFNKSGVQVSAPEVNNTAVRNLDSTASVSDLPKDVIQSMRLDCSRALLMSDSPAQDSDTWMRRVLDDTATLRFLHRCVVESGNTLKRFGNVGFILRELGQGGFGQVSVVLRVPEGDLVVAKRSLHTENDSVIGRFRAEEHALKEIATESRRKPLPPDIAPQYIASGSLDGHPYYLSRYETGATLDKYMSSKKENHVVPSISDEAGIDLLMILLRKLEYLQQNVGVRYHRDIKPANILLTPDGRILLLDFGLARATNQESDNTVMGQVMGTPMYMAPEQFQGDVSDSTDAYSAAATVFHLVTGKPPFEPEKAADYFKIHQDPDALPPLQMVRNVRLRDALWRLSQKEPSHRGERGARSAAYTVMEELFPHSSYAGQYNTFEDFCGASPGKHRLRMPAATRDNGPLDRGYAKPQDLTQGWEKMYPQQQSWQISHMTRRKIRRAAPYVALSFIAAIGVEEWVRQSRSATSEDHKSIVPTVTAPSFAKQNVQEEAAPPPKYDLGFSMNEQGKMQSLILFNDQSVVIAGQNIVTLSAEGKPAAARFYASTPDLTVLLDLSSPEELLQRVKGGSRNGTLWFQEQPDEQGRMREVRAIHIPDIMTAVEEEGSPVRVYSDHEGLSKRAGGLAGPLNRGFQDPAIRELLKHFPILDHQEGKLLSSKTAGNFMAEINGEVSLRRKRIEEEDEAFRQQSENTPQ